MVSNVTRDPEVLFVSFDVVSMFTCIPVDLSVDLITKRWGEVKIFAPSNRDMFEKVLRFFYVQFKDKFIPRLQELPWAAHYHP